MRSLLQTLFGVILFIPFSFGQTPINQSYFDTQQPNYIWDLGGSPYQIYTDILLYNGSTLTIEPGVEVIFIEPVRFNVQGSLLAIGNVQQRIIFTSNNIHWLGIRFDFKDQVSPPPSRLHYCDISNAKKTGINCIPPDPESSGGAIFVQNLSDLEIINSNIFNNSVGGQGGGIALFNGSSPLIEANNIYSNTANKKGGGLCMMNDCHPKIFNNTIFENFANSSGGGGIGIGNLNSNLGCNPVIQSNNIQYNSTNTKGGGVYICGSTPQFKDNIFRGNVADEEGGAIATKINSIVSFDGDMFENNISNDKGGGIFFGLSQQLIISINGCSFNNNSAVDGGGIYLNSAQADITQSRFSGNTASIDGAGIYILNSVSTIENCTLVDNIASGNGGGAFMKNPSQTNPTDISSVNLNTFKSNTAYQGSALYLDRTDNYTYNSYVLNNILAENHSTNMGVVYMQGNNTNTVFNHNTINNNTSTTWISGVCVDKDIHFPTVNLSLNPAKRNFFNNIIYETIVDVIIIFDVNNYPLYQQPTNYLTLANHNFLNMDQNNNPNPLPGFVSTTDYHLSNNSPCIDAGDNSASMTTKDLDDLDRIANGFTDYGCYEYGSQSAPRISSSLLQNLTEEIEIYPNPTSDVLIIRTHSEQVFDISIFDLSGKKIYSSNNNTISFEKAVSVSEFERGYYMLMLQSGSKIISKKIVLK